MTGWSEAVLGLDESGTRLRTRGGAVEIPNEPPAAPSDPVELDFDEELQRFLAKILVFTRLRGKVTLAAGTAVEPPVNLRGLGRSVIRVGAFSYSYSPVSWVKSMGRYCSLADGIVFAHVEHPTDWLSTSSFVYDLDPKGFMWRQFAESREAPRGGEAFAPLRKPRREREITIGNDVWIGSEAYLKGGVTIGDSAIVGTRAVVTKDVPPYAVAAGNPARVVRLRLPEALVERLVELRWWRFPYTELGGVPIDDVPRALAALEERVASGGLRPYSPAWISFGWIKQVTDQLKAS